MVTDNEVWRLRMRVDHALLAPNEHQSLLLLQKDAEQIPVLLDEVERLRGENAYMREFIRRVVNVSGMSEWNLAGLADAARAVLTQPE